MSDVSLAFFDPARRLSGTMRPGLTLLFEGSEARTLPRAPDLELGGDVISARLEGELALDFNATGAAAELHGSSIRLCQVRGDAGGRRVSCLGTATVTDTPTPWDELDVMRTVSAVFDPDHAVFALARRPRGAQGHGDEVIQAKLLLGGELVTPEDTRLSTVYDGEGRQRSASIELWLAEEDFPRRASGSVEAGASISLDGLRLNAALFEWRMEGREGRGTYELALREEWEAA